MVAFRIHARLDLKPPNLVKGIQFEGLRVVGDPTEFSSRYYSQGVDEILVQDIVASLYGRPSQFSLISEIATRTFVPLTVAGGIRSLEDAVTIVGHGADKIGLNTAAVARPSLITEIARELGSQAVVVIVEAKLVERETWELLTDGGRERTGISVEQWLPSLERLGAGEVLVVSVDRDGSRSGPDTGLLERCRQLTSLPLIYQGGLSQTRDVVGVADSGYQGAAIGAAFHTGVLNPTLVKKSLQDSGHEVRI